MDRKDWLMVACTAAILATLIGCAWWLRQTIGENTSWILQDLERLQR